MKIIKIILSYIFIFALLFYLIVVISDVYAVLKDPAEYHFGSEAMKVGFLWDCRYNSKSIFLIFSAVEITISLCGIFCFLIIKNKNVVFLIRTVTVICLYMPAIYYVFGKY